MCPWLVAPLALVLVCAFVSGLFACPLGNFEDLSEILKTCPTVTAVIKL